MWILKSDKKDGCLRELDARLPELLLECEINLSTSATADLNALIKDKIVYHYYTETSGLAVIGSVLLPALGIIGILSIMMQTIVLIPETASAELSAISYSDQRKLNTSINNNILDIYRDLELEAQRRAEARARTDANGRRVHTVTFQVVPLQTPRLPDNPIRIDLTPSAPTQTQQIKHAPLRAQSPLRFTQRQDSNREPEYDYSPILKMLLFMMFTLMMLNLNDKNQGMCLAPRYH